MNKEIAINKIEPNDYNPNEMTKVEYTECKEEIKHLERIPKPIVVRRVAKGGKFVIVDGEHNWKAAKELGFSKVPCEVLDVDDFEAMRQTYKRNQHGTFNRIKLGKMFERIMEESGWSRRKLAKEYDISEGTVRNAFLYLKATALRNDYAFETLTIRQLRIYMELPPVIRDKWLDAGADVRILYSKGELGFIEKELLMGKLSESNFNEAEQKFKNYYGGAGVDRKVLSRLDDIYKTGLADRITATSKGFQDSIKKIEKFCNWEYWKICYGSQPQFISKKELRKYTMHFFDKHESNRSDFKTWFTFIFYEGKFQISPEEFETILEDSRRVPGKPGWTYQHPQYEYMKSALQMLLIEKGLLDKPLEDDEKLPNPMEELARMKIEKEAPDWLTKSGLPTEPMIKMFNYMPRNIESSILEEAKREVIERYKKDPSYSFDSILGEVDSCAYTIMKKREDDEKLNEGLALSIIQLSGLYQQEREQPKRDEFRIALLHLNGKELRCIKNIMGYTDYVRMMRSFCGTKEAQRDEYWLKAIVGK